MILIKQNILKYDNIDNKKNEILKNLYTEG